MVVVSKSILDDIKFSAESQKFIIIISILSILFFILYNSFIPNIYLYQIMILVLFISILAYRVRFLDNYTTVGKNKQQIHENILTIINSSYKKLRPHIKYNFPIVLSANIIPNKTLEYVLELDDAKYFLAANIDLYNNHKKVFGLLVTGLELFYILLPVLDRTDIMSTHQKKQVLTNHINYLHDLFGINKINNKEFLDKLELLIELRYKA